MKIATTIIVFFSTINFALAQINSYRNIQMNLFVSNKNRPSINVENQMNITSQYNLYSDQKTNISKLYNLQVNAITTIESKPPTLHDYNSINSNSLETEMAKDSICITKYHIVKNEFNDILFFQISEYKYIAKW